MYSVLLGGEQLPVTPSKITMKANGNNKTLELVNEGEMSFLRTPGLTEFSFDCMIPFRKYPFSVYPDGFREQKHYVDMFERFFVGKKPIILQILRRTQDGKVMFDNNNDLKVSLEDYTITDDAKEGYDIVISVKLKEYREYKTEVIQLEEKDGKTVGKVQKTRPVTKEIPKTYTVKKGDTLWAIAKSQLGDGGKFGEIAKKNGISNPNKIFVGQVLKL